MTCYFRHMKAIFDEVGIVVTPENKKDIDRIIHKLVGVTYKDCPSTWKAVKARLAANQEIFILELRKGLAELIWLISDR